jgi:general secretion pathway protein L
MWVVLAEFGSWWIARMREILPAVLAGGAAGPPDGVVIDARPDGDFQAFVRRGGQEQAVTLGAVPRMAGRRPILLRIQPSGVLEKEHMMPAASRGDMERMLRLELPRITPFDPDSIYWRWEARPSPADRARTEVRLTIVPKIILAEKLERLEQIGIRPKLLEAGTGPVRLLRLQEDGAAGAWRDAAVRWLGVTAGVLVVTAVVLPFAFQAWDLHRIGAAMNALRPTVSQAEALRRNLDASAAGHDIVAQQRDRTGDVPTVLAAVTRVLPDNTYLTDLSLRQRQLTIAGRSVSAANLITLLAADPMFRNVAFAAPVTRIPGVEMDVFSIRAEIAP